MTSSPLRLPPGLAPASAGRVVMLLAALLSACGGGGQDAAGPAVPVSVESPAPSVPSAPSAQTAESRVTCGLADFQSESLRLINAYRAAGAQCGSSGSYAPTTPLVWNAALTQAALVHAEDLMAHNRFSHTGSDGSSPGDRATAAGYTWSAVGENIAAGQLSVAEVVTGWMNSPGHCANLMQPAFRDIGMVCLRGGAGNDYRSYWSQSLGASR